MKKKLRIVLLGIITLSFSLYSQDSWEPQTFVTGYVNTIAEYSGHADTSVLGLPATKHWGVGLAQVGLLASYKPREKLEFKSTLVYSPWIRSWHDVVVELYSSYKFNEKLIVGVGKYLTPLSPSNLYFYAPLNHSGVIPMVVSHHIFFPQSISGFQVGGEMGDDLEVAYNVTYGNFYITDHLESGIIGVQGQEEIFPFQGHYEVYEGNRPESYLGGSARLAFKYNEIVKLGLNLFEGSEYNLIVLDPATGGVAAIEPATQRSLGTDLHITLKQFKLSGEYWSAKGKTTESATEYSLDYMGYYSELVYNGDKLKPWVRYEYMDDATAIFTDGSEVNLPLSSFSTGIAYRPIFETTFKLEYRRNMVSELEETDFDSEDFKDYNYFLFSVVLSF